MMHIFIAIKVAEWGCCSRGWKAWHRARYPTVQQQKVIARQYAGYCKLTDMGLAKVTQGKTFTLVGTPDYMAPEVRAL